MTASLFRYKNHSGFTLLEIIVALTVASVLGTIVVMYMNTSLTRSTEPLTLIQNAFSLNQIIEQITIDYQSLLDADSSTALTTLRTYIRNGNNDSNTPYYGQYDQQTAFITFSNRNEDADSGDYRILKTTITSNSQTITVLFTK